MTSNLLLETGDALLLESGDNLLLEGDTSTVIAITTAAITLTGQFIKLNRKMFVETAGISCIPTAVNINAKKNVLVTAGSLLYQGVAINLNAQKRAAVIASTLSYAAKLLNVLRPTTITAAPTQIHYQPRIIYSGSFTRSVKRGLAGVAENIRNKLALGQNTNNNEQGYWKTISDALETAAGISTDFNENESGRQATSAEAAETIAGTGPTGQNENETGRLSRFADAFEANAGEATDADYIERLRAASEKVVL